MIGTTLSISMSSLNVILRPIGDKMERDTKRQKGVCVWGDWVRSQSIKRQKRKSEGILEW